MEFRVLGVVEALEHGLPVSLGGPKQKSLLAMLLLDANHTVSTDRLVDGLWGDEPPQRAAATIHVYVSKLRKVVEPDRSPRAEPSVLLTQPPGYVLAIDPADVDLFRFESMVAVARGLLADGCAVGGAVLLREALALWREAPLADLADEPFARFEVARLEEARTGAVEDRIDAELALGRAVELLPELEALVARNPYRERLHRQLMLAQYRAGQQADALAAYQRARDALVDDLGLEPGGELREMESAILVQDPELAWNEPRPITAKEVARVLHAVTLTEPDELDVATVVEEARTSARRAEDALRRAFDGQRTTRLSATVDAASASQVELERARRVIADGVLDRRVRQVPRRAPARNGPATATVVGACPYKGLLRFEPEDADWYFGRERLVAELLASVASSRGVGIVGASGSGKSSLTRAGLVAALRDDALPGSAHWPRLVVTPGTDPVLELARALAPVSHAASPDHVRDQLLEDPESIGAFASRALEVRGDHASVMIVVDQLEEVFTVCRDEELAARFLDVLVHAASDPDAPTKLLAAIRADYYGHCAQHADFAEMLGRANVLVGPMRPDELQRAIEEPARTAGLALEDGLLDRILDDVGTEPGSLPLLETALLETWNRRDGNLLTVDGYESSGGVRGAVAHLADNVYARMSSSEQAIARGIFLRLAEPGVGTDDVRRRAPLDELLVDDEHAQVLGTLVEHRLVVTSDVAAEVSHEALLREWPRLRGWLEEDREGRRVQRALSNAAQDWVTADRNDDLLFRGTRLAAALDVADAHPAEINPVERDFLGASRAHQDVELRTAQRTTHRLRRLTVGLSVVLVVALVAGAFSLVQRSRANDNADRAERAAALSDAQRLIAQAEGLPAANFDRRLLLTTEAHRLAPGPETESALLSVLSVEPPSDQSVVFDAPSAYGSSLSFDGSLVATADVNGTVRLFDAGTAKEVRRFQTNPDGSAVLALFSGDGRWLAIGSTSGAVTVWNVKTGRLVAGPLESGDGVAYGIFDRSSRHRLFVGGHDGVVSEWDLSEPSRPRRRALMTTAPPSGNNPLLVLTSADGMRLVVGDIDRSSGRPVLVVDATTGETVARFDGAPSAISEDGDLVALRRPNNRVEVVDVASRAVVSAPLEQFILPENVMAFDPSGAHLAVGDGVDKRTHVIDWRTGREVADPIAYIGILRFLDDDRLFIGGNGVSALVDMTAPDTGSEPFLPAIARRFTWGSGSGVQFTRDGRIVTTSPDGTSILVSDPDGRAQPRILPIPERLLNEPGPLSASPDQRVLSAFHYLDNGGGIEAELVNTSTGRSLGSFTQGGARDLGWWWSDDSSKLWIVFDPGTVYVWRVGDPKPTRLKLESGNGPAPGPFAPPLELAFSPDSRKLVVAVHSAGTATTYRVPGTGRGRTVLRNPSLAMRGGLSYRPDGSAYAVAAFDNLVNATRVFVFDDATGKVIDRYKFVGQLGSMAYYRGAQRLATLNLATSRSGSRTNGLDLTTQLDLWDTTGGLTHAASLSLDGFASILVPSPDGTHLLIYYGNTDPNSEPSATVWDMRTAKWVAHACDEAGRSLTRVEWKQYLPGLPYDPVCR
jgi:DNA-binding SARP family transcriptional activator/WD40 repeat protein